MKFGIRTPSLKRRISARTSWKRYVRHSMGLKAPRGMGFITNPKKAMYNKVYNKTSVSVDRLVRGNNTTKIKGSSNPRRQPHYETTPIENYDNPIVFTPVRLIEYLSQNDKTDKIRALKIGAVTGGILLLANPLLGLLIGVPCGYYLYKNKDEPWYKIRNLKRKIKNELKRDKFIEAENDLKTLVELGDIDDFNLYLLGATQHINGSYENSVSNIEKYMENVTDDSDLYLLQGYNYYNLQKYDQAVPLLQKIPENHRDYMLTILLLGDCFNLLKNYDAAIETLKRGPTRKRNLDNQLILMHYLLGKAYLGKNDKTKAKNHLSKVYAYDNGYKDVSELLSQTS